jgi:hypothetical protein
MFYGLTRHPLEKGSLANSTEALWASVSTETDEATAWTRWWTLSADVLLEAPPPSQLSVLCLQLIMSSLGII